MMNPWDQERTYEGQGAESSPSSGGGMLWLIAIIIAVVGLVLLAKNGAHNVAFIPIGISFFFMVMFLVSHRREAKRLAWRREVARMQETPVVAPQSLAYAPRPAAPDANLRKVFDRFDVKVITHGRDKYWNAQRIASFLDYARDYVDTQHASALLAANERGELDRHLDAALQRALLQHDIENKHDTMEPPF